MHLDVALPWFIYDNIIITSYYTFISSNTTFRKLEITIIDAKPMSESGFRDMKGSAGNVPASLPARNSESTGDTTIQSTQLRSHPEKGQVSTQGKFLTQQMRHTHLYTILERVV